MENYQEQNPSHGNTTPGYPAPAFVEIPNFNPQAFPTVNGGVVSNQYRSIPNQIDGTQINQPEKIDYSFISSPARIAVYDNLQSAPRVIQIPGAPTHDYIEHIAALTYQNAAALGGLIPYTVIREVSENFIHANFNEVVVSILDRGNTIRFSDQGPGIQQKELAQLPGFTSASEPMKRYIRGVGSGLPIVKDYLNISHGNISIEDNVNQGSVVTISLIANPSNPLTPDEAPNLTENETAVLKALLPQQILGVTDVNKITNIPVASISYAFSKLEEKGYVEKVNKKRRLTNEGHQIALSL